MNFFSFSLCIEKPNYFTIAINKILGKVPCGHTASSIIQVSVQVITVLSNDVTLGKQTKVEIVVGFSNFQDLSMAVRLLGAKLVAREPQHL